MKEGGAKEVRRVVGGAAQWEPGWGRGKAGRRTGSASWRAMSLHSQTSSSDHRCVTPPGSAGGGALARGHAPVKPRPQSQPLAPPTRASPRPASWPRPQARKRKRLRLFRAGSGPSSAIGIPRCGVQSRPGQFPRAPCPRTFGPRSFSAASSR